MTSVPTTIDLYDVLNVPHDAETKAIKIAFGKLVKIYHPDKPNGNAEIFELITHAYNVLSNTTSRADYDQFYKLSKESIVDHQSMKDRSEAYYKALETSEAVKPKEVAMKEFNDEMDGLRSKFKPVKITTEDITNMHDDLLLSREQDEIELSHEELFKDGKFDRVKFNEAFDMYFGGNNTAMTPYEEIDSYATNKDDFFMDIDFSKPVARTNITKSQVKNMNTSSSKYNTNNDKLSESDFDRLLRERESQTGELMQFGLEDYKNEIDKFGVFNNLGLSMNSLQWDNNGEDLNKKYQALLKSRKMD